MSDANAMKEKLRKVALADARYSPEAFYFLFEALELAVRSAGKETEQGAARHVTGQQVLAALREHALATFGPLAAQVWRAWGVRETLDWGRLVFLLVENEMLKRQEDDRLEDFAAGFDFDRAFVEGYKPPLGSVGSEES